MKLFGIRKDERRMALLVGLFFVVLNLFVAYCYPHAFFLGGRQGYYTIFMHYVVSGFDQWNYMELSCGRLLIVAMRHPLVYPLLYPLYRLNLLMMDITGHNCAVFIMAALSVLSAVYTSVFLFRTLREVIGVGKNDARLLVAFFFSIAYITITFITPDHFGLSLFLLTLTMYVAGSFLVGKRRHMPSLWVQSLLFFLTAGITLSNGVKTVIAYWFMRGRRVFAWKSVASFAVPLILLMGIHLWVDKKVAVPQRAEADRMTAIAKHHDPNFDKVHRRHDEFVKRQNGKPIDEDGILLKWSDTATPRVASICENLFGESFQIHQQFTLQDTLKTRPVIVHYSWIWNYIVEIFIVVLLVGGIFLSFRQPFMLMLLAWFGFDMVMHIGFGFGLNEVYIMAAHWAFLVPVAIGYLLCALKPRAYKGVRMAVALLTVYLFVYNLWFIVDYFLRAWS